MSDFINQIRAFTWPLELPLQWVLNVIQLSIPAWLYLVWDIIAIALIFVLFRSLIGRAIGFFKKDTLAEKADIDALVSKNKDYARSVQAAGSLKDRVAALKEVKDWRGIGEAYLAAEQPHEAVRWFKKARDYKRAGEVLHNIGRSAAAARMMKKAGEHKLAGNILLERGKGVAAAKAYRQAGDAAAAAHAFAMGKKFAESARHYLEYFQGPRDDSESRVVAARNCVAMLRDERSKEAVSDEDRKTLLSAAAVALEQAGEHSLAAQLYEEAGRFERAGEVYVAAGDLPKAIKCMEAAKQPKKAARIGGRFYEKQGKWKEAGMAYAAAEEYQRAGVCFAKAKEMVRAAEFFGKAQAFFQSGQAYMQAQRLEEAVAALQKIPDEDKNFGDSRALLGHCFYELHDYEHCAATLENHLLNRRVDKGNIDLFYKLALAHEQLGNLDESRHILYKIGSVNRSFRDIGQRISSIESRISFVQSGSGAQPAGSATGGDPSAAATQVMELVENQLGTRYHLERELGRGGMGVVYLASDKQLDRKVALKFLGSLVDHSEEYRQRFVREAKAAARINHPNIVAIYDISASQGKAYIAMEYVEGVSLFQHIEKKGKLTPREAVNIMIQACSALDALHKAGIVHRDLKPENIVIAKGGLVKLMDFGLAKAEDNRITRQNMIMGTPSYMSPEQALGKDADGRADIYAMGLVLYEMLTGEVLFLDGDVLRRQIEEVPPPLTQLVDGITDELSQIAERCVAKAPEQRFQSASELVQAMRALKA